MPIILGAQNIHHLDDGSFTGEISALMIKSCGCRLVELGHAERFQYFNETEILVNKKIHQALKYNLIPLVCIGEKRYVSNFSNRKKMLRTKLNTYFNKISINKNKKIILAYEPIWAIGKNKSAEINYSSETINFIRNYSLKKLNIKNNQLSVIYGGSVNKTNAKKFIESNHIDGIFIGRSAINAKDFIEICKMAI